MSEIEALRSTILQESQSIGTKQRFGLFSQPISTAIGDDGAYKTKLHLRAENGKPVTLPRNFYTNPTKTGQIQYFEPLKSLATSDKKDIFIEEGKRLLKEDNQQFSHGRKEANFVPAAGYKSITNSAYNYVEQKKPELNPKRFRKEDGRVKSQQRNLVTNPMSKVDPQVFPQPKHISDPYDRSHKMQVELMKKNKSLEGQAAFRPNSFFAKTFASDQQLYDLNPQLKKKPIQQLKLNIYAHEVPFKGTSPMKAGFEGYLNPFPKYMENPAKQLKRKDPSLKEKQSFRSMSTSFSRPSPSVTYMAAKRSFINCVRR